MEQEFTGTGVRFLGFRHGIDLSRIYASSDFFVFPSTTDTLGQVVMEAQASGLPVVVTNMGGPKELVREGETGLVLPSDDPDRWVDELVFLASNRSRCAAMGARARVHLADMSIERSFEHFWTAHAEIVRAHTGRRGTRTGPAAPIDPSHDRPNIPPE
jgi:glycosyltransferase involved in cell wall biosynthesis